MEEKDIMQLSLLYMWLTVGMLNPFTLLVHGREGPSSFLKLLLSSDLLSRNVKS